MQTPMQQNYAKFGYQGWYFNECISIRQRFKCPNTILLHHQQLFLQWLHSKSPHLTKIPTIQQESFLAWSDQMIQTATPKEKKWDWTKSNPKKHWQWIHLFIYAIHLSAHLHLIQIINQSNRLHCIAMQYHHMSLAITQQIDICNYI